MINWMIDERSSSSMNNYRSLFKQGNEIIFGNAWKLCRTHKIVIFFADDSAQRCDCQQKSEPEITVQRAERLSCVWCELQVALGSAVFVLIGVLIGRFFVYDSVVLRMNFNFLFGYRLVCLFMLIKFSVFNCCYRLRQINFDGSVVQEENR